uniref:Putative transmembrane protein n=1 Tax=Toxoplasma gondii COUG TaxID=1074873 RepID=A0A2G8XMM2_TOXGO|nr:putative transmembrane protein [Toxoplasma gondii COUG]
MKRTGASATPSRVFSSLLPCPLPLLSLPCLSCLLPPLLASSLLLLPLLYHFLVLLASLCGPPWRSTRPRLFVPRLLQVWAPLRPPPGRLFRLRVTPRERSKGPRRARC